MKLTDVQLHELAMLMADYASSVRTSPWLVRVLFNVVGMFFERLGLQHEQAKHAAKRVFDAVRVYSAGPELYLVLDVYHHTPLVVEVGW